MVDPRQVSGALWITFRSKCNRLYLRSARVSYRAWVVERNKSSRTLYCLLGLPQAAFDSTRSSISENPDCEPSTCLQSALHFFELPCQSPRGTLFRQSENSPTASGRSHFAFVSIPYVLRSHIGGEPLRNRVTVAARCLSASSRWSTYPIDQGTVYAILRSLVTTPIVV